MMMAECTLQIYNPSWQQVEPTQKTKLYSKIDDKGKL